MKNLILPIEDYRSRSRTSGSYAYTMCCEPLLKSTRLLNLQEIILVASAVLASGDDNYLGPVGESAETHLMMDTTEAWVQNGLYNFTTRSEKGTRIRPNKGVPLAMRWVTLDQGGLAPASERPSTIRYWDGMEYK
jgi:hypothetical protein